VLRGLLTSGREFWVAEKGRLENELSGVGASLSAIDYIMLKRPDSVLHCWENSDPTAV